MIKEEIDVNLPKIILGESGAVFLVDAYQGRLVRFPSIPREIISLNRLPDLNDSKLLIFDNRTLNHANVSLRTAARSTDHDLIILPREVLSLHHVPQDAQCILVNEESRKEGYGFYLANQDVCNRLMGRLPTIEIAGQPFYVDMKIWEFVARDNVKLAISLDEISPYEHEGTATFLYDTERKAVFHPDWNFTSIPENVVAIRIPGLVHLDPVGFATYLKKEEGYFLNRFPFKPRHSARIVPYKETNFSYLMERNLEQERKNSYKR